MCKSVISIFITELNGCYHSLKIIGGTKWALRLCLSHMGLYSPHFLSEWFCHIFLPPTPCSSAPTQLCQLIAATTFAVGTAILGYLASKSFTIKTITPKLWCTFISRKTTPGFACLGDKPCTDATGGPKSSPSVMGLT